MLLHCLQQSTLITCHFIELVDAAYSKITQDQSSCFKSLLVGHCISYHSCCETCIGGRVTANINTSWCHIYQVLQHLRLTKTWVTNHKHMDIWPDGRLHLFFIKHLILLKSWSLFLVCACEDHICEVSLHLEPVISSSEKAHYHSNFDNLISEDRGADRFNQKSK